MLFTLVIVHLFALVASNPFHKYPYVFLLDVGNEELQKTNSEQIRVSIPGGSLALRYPAIGDGDTIVHVRVSGIDFGTDLKVNIVDGGPGSKFVVVVFMGNPGVAYDAVLTIQTVSEVDNGLNGQDTDSTNNIVDNTNEISEEDANDSAEELDDSENETNKYDSKSELTQASSQNYNYADNEIHANDNFQNNAVNENSDKDYDNDELEDQHTKISDQNIEVADYDETNDNSNAESNEKGDNDEEKFDVKNSYVANEYYNREETAGVVDNLYYDRLNFVRPYLYSGARVHPDQAIQYDSGNNLKSGYESDQGYVNDDIHEVGKDNNNNYYDSDDNSPVES